MRLKICCCIIIALVTIPVLGQTEELKNFSVEVQRSYTADQNPKNVRILAMLDARQSILDEIVSFLRSETIIGQYEPSVESATTIAYILISSRKINEEWTKAEFHLQYNVAINLDIIDHIARNLRNPHKKQEGYNFWLEQGNLIKRDFEDLTQETNPDTVRINSLRDAFWAIYWYEEGKYSEGEEKIKHYSKALELKPDWKLLYTARAYAHRNNKQHDLALQDCAKALEIDPEFGNAYSTRGGIYEKLSLYEKALKEYQRQSELEPELSQPLGSMARIYRKMEDNNKALEYYDKAIERDPYNHYHYSAKGHIYSEQGDFDKALECFDKVVEIIPEDDGGYASRGNIYLQQKKDYEKAIEEYTKAIERTSKKQHLGLFYCNRGIAYLFNEEPEKAKPDFEKAVELGVTQAKAFLRQLPKTD